jgi:hypothetical protein
MKELFVGYPDMTGTIERRAAARHPDIVGLDFKTLISSRYHVERTRDLDFFSVATDVSPAIVVKLARCLDYKYWKPTPPDKADVIVSLVDAFSLCLTQSLLSTPTVEIDVDILGAILQIQFKKPPPVTLNKAIIDGIHCATRKESPYNEIVQAFNAAGVSNREIQKLVLGMGWLYVFRERHGYSQGKYNPRWMTSEDKDDADILVGKVLVDKLEGDALFGEIERMYRKRSSLYE